MKRPKIKGSSWAADLANALAMRPVYREPVEEEKPEGYYGGTGTIHQTGEVNVELDKHGKVVSVWFRCRTLPFTQTVVSDERPQMMRNTYEDYPASGIEAVVLNESK